MSNISSSKENIYNNEVKQDVKLILRNDIEIRPGSVIIVNQNGKENKYKNSGEPIIYSAHQELMLEIFKNNA